jgi:glycosyltransferase involved in cell wall biosynthesis
MSEEKGARVLLAAAPLLRTGSLLLAGDGPLASALAQAYPGACQGLCTPEQVRTLLRSSLYLVAPSICLETFGLAAAEAFSCGVPVIASAHGGLGELVEHGTTGLHVPPGDARALAAAMRWAHAHPDAMLRMGKAAYARYLERYTPQRNIRMLEDIYTTALTSPSWRNHEA